MMSQKYNKVAPRSIDTIYNLLAQSLKVDISSPERLVTPIFFAVVVLLLFSFALPDQDPSLQKRMMIAQTQMAIFFALQLTFSRAFESERTDKVFEHLKMSPIDASAFVISKILHVMFVGGLTMLATAGLSVILQGQDLALILDPVVLGAFFLALLGLSGVGVLLSAVTLRADGQAILFPLLYFPLSVPVLLSSTEALAAWVERPVWTETMRGWSTILIAFDAIYLTMAILLAPESESN
jgi:heme exporter protein CcmB